MKYIAFFLLYLLCANTSLAQDSTFSSSKEPSKELVNPGTDEALSMNKDLWEERVKNIDYGETEVNPEEEQESSNRETGRESSTFSWRPNVSFLRPLLYVVLIILAILVILFIIKRSRMPVSIARQRVEAKTIDEAEENLPDVALDNIYNEALQKSDYKSALRIKFLMILQKMLDQRLIIWKKRKTNEQYITEIENGKVKKNFATIVEVYDNTWYGNISITKLLFDEVNHTIEELNTEIYGGQIKR